MTLLLKVGHDLGRRLMIVYVVFVRSLYITLTLEHEAAFRDAVNKPPTTVDLRNTRYVSDRQFYCSSL